MKYIYLDQNKWIELARGIKEKAPDYIKLYEVIVENIDNGNWAFPLSSIHITETMKRKDETSRKNILNLMFSISRGYGIYDYMTTDAIEFNYWINNKNVDVSKLKSTIIKQEWINIIGLSSENINTKLDNKLYSINELKAIEGMMREHFCDREIFDLICNIINNNIAEDEEYYYECYKKGRESFLLCKNEIKGLTEYKEKYLYPAYLWTVFEQVYRNKITNLRPIEKENIRKLFEQNNKMTSPIANLEELPGFNIHNRLIFELYNNPNKNVHRHDFNDLAYLRIAIPYCDVVICEKYWCDRAYYYKFDERYNTTISTKLLSLMDYWKSN